MPSCRLAPSRHTLQLSLETALRKQVILAKCEVNPQVFQVILDRLEQFERPSLNRRQGKTLAFSQKQTRAILDAPAAPRRDRHFRIPVLRQAARSLKTANSSVCKAQTFGNGANLSLSLARGSVAHENSSARRS